MYRYFIFILTLQFAVSGCGKEREQQTQIAPLFQPSEPTQAQPKLATMKLTIGDKELIAEIAATAKEMQTGMMFRTNLAENAGMLFIYPVPQRAGFWMKNTYVPLSVAYIDPVGIIQEIHDLQPKSEKNVLSASDQIQFILEVNQGWFERNNIKPGTVIITEQGSLKDTFKKHLQQ